MAVHDGQSHRSGRRSGWAWPLRGRIVPVALVLLGALGYGLGPVNTFGPHQPSPREAVPADVAQLEGWLAQQEAQVPGIRPGVQRQVHWHGQPGQRTAWSVVYVHGFTATRLETAPLAQQVADRLGANLYETRLTGHGQTAEALGQARVQDWLADVVEAQQMGHRLGERVLLIGVSTGATLLAWAGQHPQWLAPGPDVQVWVSPNFGPRAAQSELINLPWGRELALWVEGEQRGRVAERAAENLAWTTVYPTRALFPMMALVKAVREGRWAHWPEVPVLVLYADGDQTVNPQRTAEVFEQLGANCKHMERVDYSEAQGQHVLAGDLMAPQATERMAQRLAQWAQAPCPR